MQVKAEWIDEIEACSRCDKTGVKGIRQTIYLKESMGFTEAEIIETCESCVSSQTKQMLKDKNGV